MNSEKPTGTADFNDNQFSCATAKIAEVSPVHFAMDNYADENRRAAFAALVEALVVAGSDSTFISVADFDNLTLLKTPNYRFADRVFPDEELQLLSKAQIEREVVLQDSPEREDGITVVNLIGSTGSLSAIYRCSMKTQIERARSQISRLATKGSRFRARLHFAFGCPYQGNVDPKDIIRLSCILCEAGFEEIVLTDNLGIATPKTANELVSKLARLIPANNIGIRFHDTYGLALANIYSCLPIGIGIIESCLGGVFAQSNGNYPATPVATEDVVNLLHGLGIHTGFDLSLTISASLQAAKAQGLFPRSKTAAAWYTAGCV